MTICKLSVERTWKMTEERLYFYSLFCLFIFTKIQSHFLRLSRSLSLSLSASLSVYYQCINWQYSTATLIRVHLDVCMPIRRTIVFQ